MAEHFSNSGSISFLVISSSYIGSGSTSFNKDNSFLYINNGLRQGINNRSFSTTSDNSEHIQGFNNNTPTPSSTALNHLEGSNNNISGQTFYAHIEGNNNFPGRIFYSHIEGTNNICGAENATAANIFVNHIEGGYNNLAIPGGMMHHIEGYLNTASCNQSYAHHIEGYSNTLNGNNGNAHRSHVEGAYHNVIITQDANHIEGTNNGACFGARNHLEGYNNVITAPSNLGSNHAEGGSNSILLSTNSVVCGISCSIISSSNGFVSGLGLRTYYQYQSTTGVYTFFIAGQWNSSSSYFLQPVNSINQRAIYGYFTIGGGINDTTRATICEITHIATSSNYQSFVTRSIILPWVSESGDFINDTAATAGGIPLGGFYRTGNNLKIRLS